MKTSPLSQGDERPAADIVLPPNLAAADPHVKEDLSPAVINALFPQDMAELEDQAQADLLARHGATLGGHPRHRAVKVPGTAIQPAPGPLPEGEGE